MHHAKKKSIKITVSSPPGSPQKLKTEITAFLSRTIITTEHKHFLFDNLNCAKKAFIVFAY